MSYSATYPIHEGYKTGIFADVEYDIDPGGRGGRWEPSSQPIAIVESAQLYRITKVRTWVRDQFGTGYVDREDRTDLGPAPKWVLDLIEEDTDWLLEIAMEDA